MWRLLTVYRVWLSSAAPREMGSCRIRAFPPSPPADSQSKNLSRAVVSTFEAFRAVAARLTTALHLWKRRGEPKAELSLELVLEGVGGEGGGVRTVDTDIEGLAGERR